MNRIVLGTVQLGLPYGVRATSPLISAPEAERILDAAWDLGIRAFDTAEAYGCAAERLSEWLTRRGRTSQASVVTKVLAGPGFQQEAVRAAAARFDQSDCTVLTHGFTAGDAWRRFAAAVSSVGAAPGQSVYAPDEVRAAVGFSGMTRVQAPGNVFDDRARQCRANSAVALDLRSVFLQGILLMPADVADRRVSGMGTLVSHVTSAAARCGRGPGEMLVAVILRRLRPGDRLVIGADTQNHLDVLPEAIRVADREGSAVTAFERELTAHPRIEERLLDPRRWPVSPVNG